MTTCIHFVHLPKIVQFGWRHHVEFCVWKNRPLLLAKAVCTRLCLYRLVQAKNTKIKAPHHWPFMTRIHQWRLDFPHKGSVKRKASYHGVIMLISCGRNEDMCLCEPISRVCVWVCGVCVYVTEHIYNRASDIEIWKHIEILLSFRWILG